MRTLSTLAISLAMPLLLASGPTFGAGGGSMPSGGSMPGSETREARSPEDQARDQYNGGVRLVEKADELMSRMAAADAAHQADDRKQQKALSKSNQAYASALKKFTRATEINPSMYQAWNYVGYTNRRLGNFEAALAAYDRALRLKPDYAEAIEYRGHAYLGLNRLSEAKEAYLSLYSANRKLAAQLLAGMQDWVGAHRANTGGLDVDSFASWVNERSSIAGKTASLTREGASAAW
jgi:tetratricopeptide (TPR) repeat protein